MINLVEIIDKLQGEYTAAKGKNTGEAYMRLATIVDELSVVFREQIQEMTQDDIKVIINKLKEGQEISTADKDKIRLWMVGDAEYYIKMQNNFGDWEKELDRIMSDIPKYKIDNPDTNSLSQLAAVLRDASEVLGDIYYYLQEKERVENFAEAIEDLDNDERSTLVRLLEQKMRSEEF